MNFDKTLFRKMDDKKGTKMGGGGCYIYFSFHV